MIRLASDSELRSCMGKAGQKRVSELFDWENKAKAQASLYEKIIEKQYLSNSVSSMNF